MIDDFDLETAENDDGGLEKRGRRVTRSETGNATRSDLTQTWREPAVSTPRCSDCGRPFSTEERRLLHRGLEHPDRLTDHEREAYATVATAERGAHRRYVLGALIVLAVTYFGFLFAYAIVA
ncbi:hypothetical protein [Natronosalvus rutilus]|uniref:C2H2-type domain-containing protein n=1 Tax=Natronosalvus rutilus TaxID=2953753 RepID=A0A9E7SU29_9EURY|nr:hypothetical protein [Natronosalvus rutilus]UTF52392.1 hypothetical protein NGM29_11385 [Natronosalvus rutilus]